MFVVNTSEIKIICTPMSVWHSESQHVVKSLVSNRMSLADPHILRLSTSIASKAISAVPSASVVTVIMILTSCDIPADAVALLLAIEWFL